MEFTSQSFWNNGHVTLTLMTEAISFLITERSRVNLHICKEKQLRHLTKPRDCSVSDHLIKRKNTAPHHKVSAATEHFCRDPTVRAAGVFRIQNITRKTTKKHHLADKSVSWTGLPSFISALRLFLLTSSQPSSPEPAAPPAGCSAALRLSLCQRQGGPSG